MTNVEVIYDAITGETVERQFTKAEIAAREALKIATEKEIAAQLEKDAARQAVLEKLGLTEEEASLLLA